MMNPIEDVFSKIKLQARIILSEPDQREQLVDVIEESDCNNYFMYMLTKIPRAQSMDNL